MLKINDIVLYASQGVCRVSDITKKNFGTAEADYYVLTPVYKETSKVYVPVDSLVLCAKMRTLSTLEELNALLDNYQNYESLWEDNQMARHEKFTKILEGGTSSEILNVIYTLKQRFKELTAVGKRLRISDERVLNDAERLIHEEVAFVANIPRDQSNSYINSRISPNEV